MLLTPARAQDLGSRFAGHLLGRGHRPGDRVAFSAPNSALLLGSVLGALRAGFAAVVLGATLTDRERNEQVSDVGAAVLIHADDLPNAQGAERASLDDWFHSRPMHFTSGTTGRPRAVWGGWFDRASSRAYVAEEQAAWGTSASDVHLVCGPMSHSAPLRFPLITLASGGSVIVPGRFDPGVAGRLISEGMVTSTFLAPTLLMRLLDSGALRSPGRMRLVAHAGSPCPQHVRTRARAVLGDDVLREFYGSTEGQFTICTPTEFDDHPGTVGRARPGRRLRVGPDGRIWCQVPPHARFAYWGDPAKTSQAWDGDWFTVGDLGRIDDDGYLYLDGRRDDLIITGGVNVYPAEIERVVLDLPGVVQAVAFGVDDERWGQRVCLAVVGPVGRAQVQAHCTELLAGFKRPKDIIVVDALPLTHSGKVDRRRVPDVMAEHAQDEG